MTIAVVILIVYTLLRWIDHLSKLGRVGETIDRVEAATIKALIARRRLPYLGGCAYADRLKLDPPGCKILSREVGYVQHIDVHALEAFAKKHAMLSRVVVRRWRKTAAKTRSTFHCHLEQLHPDRVLDSIHSIPAAISHLGGLRPGSVWSERSRDGHIDIETLPPTKVYLDRDK